MTPKPLPLTESEETHVQTATRHVWRDVATGRFVFEDETQCFNGDYATEAEARDALVAYAATL